MSERHRNAHDTAGVAGHGSASVSDLHTEGSRRELLIGSLLFVAVFAFHLVLESKLRAMGAFACLNTLFNADPGLTLEAMCCGGGSNHLSHPLLEYFFSIPIAGIVKLGSLLTSGGLDDILAKRSLALVMVPAAAGLQAFVWLRLFRRLGLSLRSASLLVLLGSLLFSRIVFGSMPESYCLSALCISLAYLLFLRTRGRSGVRVELTWIALGVLTAGITVTNIVVVAVLYFLRELQLGRNLWGRCVRTALMAALALVVTLGAGLGLDRLFDAQPGGTPDEIMWISRYLVDDPVVQLLTFPTAVINGIAPPVPERKPNMFALRAEKAAAKGARAKSQQRRVPLSGISRPVTATDSRATDGAETRAPRAVETRPVSPDRASRPRPDRAREDASGGDTVGTAARGAPSTLGTEAVDAPVRMIPFSLTLQRTHDPTSARNLIGVALLAGLAWVALKEKRLDPTFRSLACASLVVLAFNWVLHGFWGGEQFLYSQHWHVSLLVLMGAVVSVLEARRLNAVVPLIMGAVGVALSNSIVLVKTLQSLLGD